MGEYADLLLDGECCEQCQCALPGPAPGHPRLCKECRREQVTYRPDKMFARCPTRKKRVKLLGLTQHMEAKHGR